MRGLCARTSAYAHYVCHCAVFWRRYNKSKVRNYGNYFRKDDTVGVQLDMDNGTLEFFLNGLSLGIAVRNLQGLQL